MPWIGAAIGLAGNALFSDGGGGGGGGSPPYYTPTGVGAADQSWQGAQTTNAGIADSTRSAVQPAYWDSYMRSLGIDPSGYLQGAQRSGQAYGQAGDAAMGQMGAFGQRAAGAAGAEDMMYDAASQVWKTASDPQNALYDRTAHQLTDQVRAGQAARGLGNSEVGQMEEGQTMANFNIDWQNAQLARQATGIQAAGGAVGAGVGAGRMYGADQSAALAAGAAGAGYYGQAGMVPYGAQQAAAAYPGQAAGVYQGQETGVAGMYGNLQTQAIPYMNYGQGAQQANYQNVAGQNAAMVSGLSQFGQAFAPTVKDWFSGTTGGGTGGGQWNNPSAYGGGAQPYMADTNTYNPVLY